MAEMQQEPKSKKATRKTGGTTGRTTRKKKSEEAAGEDSACTDGAERLRWAADRRVGRNSEKLAKMLTDQALKGDLASAKVLLALAEGKKPAVEKKGPVRSLALRLAAEPQWVPPVEKKEEPVRTDW
jgi:hypothetical protein